MWEAALVVTSGMLGSSHCLGMCGGFVATIGAAAPSARDNFMRQIVYTAGRIFTYVFLGAVGGFFGLQLLSSPWWRGGQSVLALIAGFVLIAQGFKTLGLGRPRAGKPHGACLEAEIFASFLSSPRLRDAFLAGLATGFIPCGLVYAFLALSVSSAAPISGMMIMALFGLGTAPTMILAGCTFGLASLVLRRRMIAIAAWCVIVAGAFSIVRGARSFSDPSVSPCPFSSTSQSAVARGDWINSFGSQNRIE